MLIYICYKECRYVAVCQFISPRARARARARLSGRDYVIESVLV